MKFKVSKETLSATGGIAICLFALLVVLSQNTIFSFLANTVLLIFGFIGFWLFVPALFSLGMYFFLRKKTRKFHYDLFLWGIYVLILVTLMVASAFGSEGVLFDKSINNETTQVVASMFKKGNNPDEIPYAVMGFGDSIKVFANACGAADGKLGEAFKQIKLSNAQTGGGLVGYVLLATFNSIHPAVSIVVIVLATIGGIALIFHRRVKQLFNYIKSGKQRKAAKEDVYSPEINVELDNRSNEYKQEEYVPEADPIETPQPAQEVFTNDLAIRNFNNNHGLQKAVFVLDDGQSANVNNDVQSSEPSFAPINNEVVSESTPEMENVESSYEEKTSDTEEFNDFTPSFMGANNEQEPLVKEEVNIVKPQENANEYSGDPLHRPQPKVVSKPPFKLPPMSLLDYHENLEDLKKNDESCASRTELLNMIFSDMNVGAEVVGHTIGPSVTRFDVKTNSNVSVQAIKRIEQDISVRLGGVVVRFVPIVLGKATSGLEIQNEVRTNVGLRESIEKIPEGEKFIANIPFGKDISGNLIHANLKDFPHLLVAGATGSGKSIFVHCCIVSLLMRNTPDQLKLVLIDPKKVEMNYYKEIPHLLCPNISKPEEAKVALNKLVDEMERRYNLFEANRVRDIKGFNQFAKEHGIQPLPTIAVFIDEYADLSEACKDIRTPVVRIAQKARSAGIHLIIATQRPSVNVIDGVIKANLPSHVALMVANATDSSVIIGEGGAEALLGNGDMIVECAAVNRQIKPRVQGCYVDETEINRVTDYLREQGQPEYDPNFLDLTDHSNDINLDEEIVVDTAALKEASEDQLYNQIKSDLAHKEYCSISFIQRTYGVGFPKAGRLFAKLQKEGIVAIGGDARGSKVLVHDMAQSEGVTSIDESHVYEDSEANLDENSEQINPGDENNESW